VAARSAPADAVLPPPGHPRFPHVDALRAIAALCVVAVHVTAYSGITQGSALGAYSARLNVGVAIFFAISGFLLYRPFVADARAARAPMAIRDFARRRILRIVPAYWLALTLLAIAPGLPGVFSGDWWIYYGFGQIYQWDTTLGGIAPAWTLCIEMTFYALLPFYALALRRVTAGRSAAAATRIELGSLAALAAGALVLRTVLHARPGLDVVVATLPGMFGWFAVGMALAVVSVADGRGLRALARRPWTAWILAVVAFWVVSTRIGAPRGYAEDQYSGPAFLAEHVLYALIAVLILIPAVVAGDDRGPRRLLAWPLLAWMGLISYGIYLWHMPILAELHQRGVDDWPTLIALGVTLAVACATASYYLVERPILARK